MTDKLREAAQAALEELIVSESNAWNIINDLEAALAEQKPMLEMNPEKRPWVGLTHEDMADAHNSTSGDVMMRLVGFARAIETKLREKNT